MPITITRREEAQSSFIFSSILCSSHGISSIVSPKSICLHRWRRADEGNGPMSLTARNRGQFQRALAARAWCHGSAQFLLRLDYSEDGFFQPVSTVTKLKISAFQTNGNEKFSVTNAWNDRSISVRGKAGEDDEFAGRSMRSIITKVGNLILSDEDFSRATNTIT